MLRLDIIRKENTATSSCHKSVDMRFVFINLHTNQFVVKTMEKYLTKRSFAPKHRFFVEYLLENDFEVACLINKKGSFLSSYLGIPTGFLSIPLACMEYKTIMKNSGLPKEKIKLLKSPAELKDNDVVILYNVFRDNFIDVDKITCTKIGCLLHFFGTKNEAKQLKHANVSAVFAEANLQKTSKIFKQNFKWYNKKFLTLPFVFQERFKNKRDFVNRKNKAIAMGTLTINQIPDFIEVYGNGIYQPLRKQILDNKDALSDIIDCYISLYNEKNKLKKLKPSDSKVIKKLKMIYNLFCSGQQKKYFSFDMVEKYNEYKICIVPEDIQGMPGIGFVEGMACGCAYIGLDYCGYTDIGMVSGIHYISYDGTLEDLRKKCEYYLSPEHERELRKIAENGYKFAREHFTKNYVGKLLVDKIMKIQVEEYESRKES